MKKHGLAILVFLLALIFAFGAMPVSAAASYTESVSVPSLGTGLMLEPSFIYRAESFDAIVDAYAEKVRPATVLLVPDAQMNVTLGGETKSLQETFETHLNGKFIPAVQLTSETADAFVSWMKGTCYIQDIMAVTSDIGVIQKLYADDTCYIVNTVYDLTSQTIGEDRYELWQYVGAANAAGCNILLFDASDPNLSVAAEYVSAMMKVCWAASENKEESVAAVAAGCLGVVSQSASDAQDTTQYFEKSGFARAQFVSSHRGITAYANENSLTAIAAAANEGATHVEVDLQICADGTLLLCHESDAGSRSTGEDGTWFATNSSKKVLEYILNDYSDAYGETFPTLEEVIGLIVKTDMILMLELKIDNGSALAVDSLRAIEKLSRLMDKYPEMEGRWFAITFFAPYARQMRELMPEIPVGFLGYGSSDNKEKWPEQVSQTLYAEKIPFLREHNVLLDETMTSTPQGVSRNLIARGFLQNTWTFEDTSHFARKVNIATTDAAQDCAALVKKVCPSGEAQITQAQLEAGKVTVNCLTYNGFVVSRECELIVVSENGNQVTGLLYYLEKGDTSYGIYSGLVHFTVV